MQIPSENNEHQNKATKCLEAPGSVTARGFFYGGSMKSIAHDFYNSTTWRQCQSAYMKHANGLCERCLANGDITPAKIVHHKTHLNKKNMSDASIAYGFDNLEALCQDCHNKEHFGQSTPKRYKLDGNELIY